MSNWTCRHCRGDGMYWAPERKKMVVCSCSTGASKRRWLGMTPAERREARRSQRRKKKRDRGKEQEPIPVLREISMSDVKLTVDGVEIEEVRRLSLKPGDIVMLSTERILRTSEGERIRIEMKSFLKRLGYENEVVILDGGLRVEVVG